MKVKVTVYKDHLIIEGAREKENKEWVPIGPGRLGCVLLDTAKNLGVSEEAMEWLKKVPKSHDDIGDLDAWKCDDGKWAFSWFGGVFNIKKNPEKMSTSRSDGLRDFPHHVIPNDPPKGAIEVIEDDERPC